MSRQKAYIGRLVKRWSFFVPFTWYGLLFVVAAYLGYRWLLTLQQQPGSSYSDIFSLLIEVGAWFIGAVMALALLSVVISYIYFLLKKNKQEVGFQVETVADSKPRKKQLQVIKVKVHPVLRPLLGFVKLRLQYDEKHFSDKFSIVQKPFGKFINTTLEGTYNWPLPEIKEYKLQQAFVYFEDYFQFFSLAVQLPVNSRFFTQPFEKHKNQLDSSPRKTEDTNTRIEEIKRIEGEFLNYKNFEDSDDVRRIVWKIYAKSGELVVRIPEVLDPYASHLYMYASFYSDYETTGNNVVNIPFLNYYKTAMWSVYQQLVKKGFEIRYVADQELPVHHTTDEQQNVRYRISTSKWQRERDLKSFVKTNEASVLVISSLTSADQVAELAEQYGDEILIIFIKLSNGLRKQYITDWLQWVFVQEEKSDLAKYRTNWAVSALKSKLMKNEKKIQAILSKHNKPVVI
ncbi:DUF58 domain-containing protein [Foetidibacter luteolus]|uniref:DUF58 domain-containing protein n=1 Tax=Foetidibacter luteolus TaxID=2608880 RepID=UPI00129BCAB9|nr:DUF58 domain-containing protein [Foetidibacter luteolus]